MLGNSIKSKLFSSAMSCLGITTFDLNKTQFFIKSTPAADHKNDMLKNDVDSGICIKTDVVFWIIYVVTKCCYTPFWHF